MAEDAQQDFFVSYNRADRAWAEWIAWQLEAQGYATILQAWDFRPGSNFVLEMQSATSRARCTLAVLSPDYLTSLYTQSEWAAAFVQDPTGKDGTLLPIRVRTCELTGLLSGIIFLDLVDLDEDEAVAALLAGVRGVRSKSPLAPRFPGKTPPSPHFSGSLPPICNAPYHRNPFFTGREDLLKQLHDYLVQGATAALTQPPAITGLGGIGKTQVALEYTYRYQTEYQSILWVNATSNETLIAGFGTLARLLALPEQDTHDQNLVVEATKHWLASHDHWLLVLDNTYDLTLISAFLPVRHAGHILLTTRASAVGSLATSFPVATMNENEGTIFLLRRAKILTMADTSLSPVSEATREAAAAIVKDLGGLALALDQAGAYLEEAACTLQEYLRAYQRRHMELLQERGADHHAHPEPVATTWSLNLEQVQQQSPAAADLLHVLAFLAPDAIPEAMLLAGASELGATLEALAEDDTRFNTLTKALNCFSLVLRTPEKQMLTIHPLVQAVIRATLTDDLQRQWAERTIRMVNRSFPDVTDYRNWLQCQQYLPHALACATWIDQWQLAFPEAARLLNQVGYFLNDHAQYEQAESLHQRALHIREQALGPNHPNTATSLSNLALLYVNQGRYEQAEPLLKQALHIYEQALGPNHLHTATGLSNLAVFYDSQGWYEQAESFYQRALHIREQALGPNHPNTAISLNNLAALYRDQGRYEQAESLYQRAVAILEKNLGQKHPQTKIVHDNYNSLLENMKRQKK